MGSVIVRWDEGGRRFDIDSEDDVERCLPP